MRKIGIFRGLAVVVCVLSITTMANADLFHFQLESDSLGVYPTASGAVINYEMYLEVIDDDADGPDTQGLSGFEGNLLTDVGVAPTVAAADTTEGTTYTYQIDDPLWLGGKTGFNQGGFGMGFVTSNGTPSGDDVFGPGYFMPLIWDADVSDGGAPAGVNPYSLKGIGYGTPTAANTPTYGTMRSRWYLLAGVILVPPLRWTYTITWAPGETNVIRNGLDLNNDITTGYVESVTLTGNDMGDSVTIRIPEPAALSALLFAAAGLVTRRRS